MFSAYFWSKRGQSSDVSARPGKAVNKPRANGIAILPHNDRNYFRGVPGRPRIPRTERYDHVHFETNQVGRIVWELIRLALRKSKLDDNIFALYIPKRTQTLPKRLDAI